MVDKKFSKKAYFTKVTELLQEHNNIIIVETEHVGSSQMHQIRFSLRKKATILMGKNTMFRKVVKDRIASDYRLEALLPHIKGEVGFIFCKGNLIEIMDIINANKIKAPVTVDSLAPVDVIIKAGSTNLEPTRTCYLAANNIATKISRGTIEIVSDVWLIKKGEKVNFSQAAILSALNIQPCSIGLRILNIYYNGYIYAPHIDCSFNDILSKFQMGIQNIVAIGLQIGYPSIATVPHSLINGFKNLLAVAIETQYSFKRAEAKNLLAKSITKII